MLSVSMLMICLRNALSSKKILMILPRDLLIFWPSVPGTYMVSFSIFASGIINVSPIWWLKREATSRVISICCNWSLPTGTKLASYNKISAAISIGYENKPAFTSSSLSALSLKEWANVNLWKGKKQLKYQDNSAVCGTSDWR